MMATLMVSLVFCGGLFLIALCRDSTTTTRQIPESTAHVTAQTDSTTTTMETTESTDRVTSQTDSTTITMETTESTDRVTSQTDSTTTTTQIPESTADVTAQTDSTTTTMETTESTAHVTAQTVMSFEVAVLVLNAAIQGSVDTTTNFEYREVKSTLEQNHTGSLLMTSTAHSQTECAIECSATLCISFSYNTLTRECRLYEAEICHRDDGVTSSDVKVFTKIIQPDSDALINNNGTLC